MFKYDFYRGWYSPSNGSIGVIGTRRRFSTLKIAHNVEDTIVGVMSLVTPRRFFQDGGFTSYILTLCVISNMQLYRPPSSPSPLQPQFSPFQCLNTSYHSKHLNHILQIYIITISCARNACDGGCCGVCACSHDLGRDGCGGNGAGEGGDVCD